MQLNDSLIRFIRNRKDIMCSVRKVDEKYVGVITLGEADGFAPLFYTKKLSDKDQAKMAAEQIIKEVRGK